MTNDKMTERIIGAAIKVHSALGAGCLESSYHACLSYQLQADGRKLRHC
jgi:GxxExxY protein